MLWADSPRVSINCSQIKTQSRQARWLVVRIGSGMQVAGKHEVRMHPRGELIISTAAVALATADKTNERRGAC
ncbi:hypothetical protein M0802_002476 [Mischocyttarus mexicanus]|nr:hypothetical protein M0802_002476 [Mischocyttarus mexicanus]